MTYTSKTPKQQQNLHALKKLISMYVDNTYAVDDELYTPANTLLNISIFGIIGDITNGVTISTSLNDFSVEFFGISYLSCEWEFLFSSKWSDDIGEAIARLTMYIDGFDPSNESWSYDDSYTYK